MNDREALDILEKVRAQMGTVWAGSSRITEAIDHITNRLKRESILDDQLRQIDQDLQRLQDECDSEREEKERLIEENKTLRDLCQKLQVVAPVQQEYDYRVIRTYDVGSRVCDLGSETEDLDKYFKAGYEFVRASELVQVAEFGSKSYIEYIVRKRRQQT